MLRNALRAMSEDVYDFDDVYGFRLEPGEPPPIQEPVRQPREGEDAFPLIRHPVKASPRGTFSIILEVLATFVLFMLWFATAWIMQYQIWLIFAIAFASTYTVRFYNDDLWTLLNNGYETFAIAFNWLVDDLLNPGLEEIRPFIPVYNWYTYFQQLWWKIFWQVIDVELMVELLMILIDITWQLMPTLVEVIQVLVPALVQIIQALTDIVTTLFDQFLQVFIDLIVLLAQLVSALVPVLPALIQIFSTLIQIVVQDFGPFFVQILDMFFLFIEVSIPFILDLVGIITTIFTNVANEIATNGLGTGSGGLGQFFDFLFLVLIESLNFLGDLIEIIFDMIVTLVSTNLPRIVAFIVAIVLAIIQLIPGIVTLLLSLASGPTLSLLVTVVESLLQAFIDIAPAILDVFEDLVTSGIMENLLEGLFESLMTAGSPTFITTFVETLGFVLLTIVEWYAFVLSTIFNVIIIFFPALVDILILLLDNGFLVTFLEKVIEFIAALMPLYVIWLKTLIVDVLFNVLIRLLIENAVDAFNALLSAVVQLIVGAPIGQIVLLGLELINMIVTATPTIIQILLQMLVSFLNVLGLFYGEIAKAIIRLFVENDFVVLVFDIIFELFRVVILFVFGFDIEIMQFLFDFYFRLILPFFKVILIAFGAAINLLNPEESGAGPGDILNSAVQLVGYVLQFLADIFGLLGDILEIFQRTGVVLALQQGLYFLVETVLRPAWLLYNNIIRPALCPIDLMCCSLFNDFACCIFPAAFCNCACNDDGGCPPAQSWSCFF